MKTPTLTIQKFSRPNGYRAANYTHARNWFFRIRAANGEIICASEGYKTARARNKTVRLLVEAKIEEAKP